MKKLIVLTCLLASAGAWGQVCKHVDKTGSVSYSDGACPKEGAVLAIPAKAGPIDPKYVEWEKMKEEGRERRWQASREQGQLEEAARQQRVAAKQQAAYDQQQALARWRVQEQAHVDAVNILNAVTQQKGQASQQAGQAQYDASYYRWRANTGK